MVPVTVTEVPPAVVPTVGESAVTVGSCCTTVESLALAVLLAPPPESVTLGESGELAFAANCAVRVMAGPEPTANDVVRVHDPDWPEPLQLQPVPAALTYVMPVGRLNAAVSVALVVAATLVLGVIV